MFFNTIWEPQLSQNATKGDAGEGVLQEQVGHGLHHIPAGIKIDAELLMIFFCKNVSLSLYYNVAETTPIQILSTIYEANTVTQDSLFNPTNQVNGKWNDQKWAKCHVSGNLMEYFETVAQIC